MEKEMTFVTTSDGVTEQLGDFVASRASLRATNGEEVRYISYFEAS